MAIFDVIKYNGGPDVFAWKYPKEEIGTWSQLIVNESQEAVLFKDGQALDVFYPGRHTLETSNIPLLNKIINLPFGGRSPFAAEIWYINKGQSLDVKWGTPTPIQLQDPKYKIFIPLRSFGQFGIQIEDARQFLLKLVGTLSVFDKETLLKFFRGMYLTKVKDALSSYLVNEQISVLEINAHLEELSEHLKEKLLPVMAEYGICLLNFYINDINVPENDPAVAKLKEALAKRAEMDIVGYNYVQQRSFDTLEGAATNSGSGQAGFIGAEIGRSIGSMMNIQFEDLTRSFQTTVQMKSCPNCNALVDMEKRFCSECGSDTQKQEKIIEKITCSQCNSRYGITVKFCPECGKPYNPCPQCKADVKQDAEVCHLCGSSMPKPCPGCSVMVSREAKFCPECGITLVKKCTNCNAEIKGTPKFCPECGNKV